MIQRFTEVSAPLEDQIQTGIWSAVWQTIRTGVRLRSSFNDTIHDAELTERTTVAIFDALEPGSAPFCIIVAALVSWVVGVVLERVEARRILRSYEMSNA